jgi:hypothetical protein
MKTGVGYALCLVIAVLVLMLLIQHRYMSSLRNDAIRMGADSRALHGVMHQDDVSAAAAQRELRRLERENAELRDETNRLQNELRKDKKTPAPASGISKSRPF